MNNLPMSYKNEDVDQSSVTSSLSPAMDEEVQVTLDSSSSEREEQSSEYLADSELDSQSNELGKTSSSFHECINTSISKVGNSFISISNESEVLYEGGSKKADSSNSNMLADSFHDSDEFPVFE